MPVAPKFGASGVTTRRRSRAADNLIHRDGFVKTPYFRKENGSVATTIETTSAWGIQGSGVNALGRPLASASLAQTEEVVVHETWTGEQPLESATPPKLIYVDVILIVSAEKRLSISGRGTLPSGYAETDVGNGDQSLTIQSAIGTTTVSCSDAMLVSVSDESNVTNWTTWTLEFLEYTSPEEGEDGQRHLITATIPSDVTASLYTINSTTTLGEESFATVETSIEEHFALAQASAWPTT